MAQVGGSTRDRDGGARGCGEGARAGSRATRGWSRKSLDLVGWGGGRGPRVGLRSVAQHETETKGRKVVKGLRPAVELHEVGLRVRF
ncbi:hypothetical protein GUJ93_ZPchr0010g8991 [Zizania palustris]|uniref:Uncharacterized protein n=1 Tax=Zizania palustris TaxID=103762 RepID=A0A8J6BMY3_ZIZPA|nr:hypothetical protein GUJ93_ZPchr0010g8991 [Zizania palustris]